MFDAGRCGLFHDVFALVLLLQVFESPSFLCGAQIQPPRATCLTLERGPLRVDGAERLATGHVGTKQFGVLSQPRQSLFSIKPTALPPKLPWMHVTTVRLCCDDIENDGMWRCGSEMSLSQKGETIFSREWLLHFHLSIKGYKWHGPDRK